MSEAQIPTSSFDWTMEIYLIKELLYCSVLRAFDPLIATDNITISNLILFQLSSKAEISQKGYHNSMLTASGYTCISPPTRRCHFAIIALCLHERSNVACIMNLPSFA